MANTAKPTGKEYADTIQSLLGMGKIPYVNGGESTSGMDCQGQVEWGLRKLGVKSNMKGSNQMWRQMCTWTGTPEECKKTFGKIPVGALLFILENDGGEVARGYTDGLGNASHVGVYTGIGDGAVHASSSRGCVAASKFKGKTIPNGGWNRVGLCKYLDYGLDGETESALIPSGKETIEVTIMNKDMMVNTPDMGTLNMRRDPKKGDNIITRIPYGVIVSAIGTQGEWTQVAYGQYTGWVMSTYLQEIVVEEQPPSTGTQAASETVPDNVTLTLELSAAQALKAALIRAGV